MLCLVAQSCPTLATQAGTSVHGDCPGKNTGVGCHALLQGIFLIQGSNPGLPNCRQILWHLSQQESSRILEWVAYPFSRGSSQARNWTGVSSIAGGFFTSWATRETIAQLVKNMPAVQEIQVWSLVWRRESLPTLVFWPGEFHGLCRPWDYRVRHDWATFTLHFITKT